VIFQFIILVLLLPDPLAVASNVLELLAITVGVPEMLLPIILRPTGNVSAVYTMALPAALLALKP
jgi:hypothetical protein